MKNEELTVGTKYEIHGYKHDGKIHRSWDEAVLLKQKLWKQTEEHGEQKNRQFYIFITKTGLT